MPRTAQSFTYSARAVVLRARPLGEKDRVLTLFCAEKGKVSAVAKGARGTKSKLAALAQPFVKARFLLAHGRSLEIVSQAQVESAHPNIVGDVFKTAWASFVCEVVDTLPDALPDEDGFERLEVALGALDWASDANAVEAAGVWFEAGWLAHQGYAPTVGLCVACGEKISVTDENSSRNETRIVFSAQLGGTLCNECRAHDGTASRVPVAALRALHRLTRSRRPPQSLADAPFDLSANDAAQLALCVRASTLAHLGNRFKTAPWLEEQRAAFRLAIRSPSDEPEKAENLG